MTQAVAERANRQRCSQVATDAADAADDAASGDEEEAFSYDWSTSEVSLKNRSTPLSMLAPGEPNSYAP